MPYFGPDISDSEDDDDYFVYSDTPKVQHQQQTKELTPQEKLNQRKNQLYYAICSGKVKEVKEHLTDDIPIDVDLQGNWTPLLLSASIGNPEITEELLNRGADPNSSKDGCTALMMAANCPKETSPYEHSLQVARYLVEHGAKVKTIDRKRITPLMFASNAGNLLLVKYLLPISDKQAQDNQKWTALFWAVSNNQVDVVEYLIEENLSCNTTDVRGNTPLDIAKTNGFKEIEELLSYDDIEEFYNVPEPCFDEVLDQTNNNGEPIFFQDICEMLCGMKSQQTIKLLKDSDICLKDFLSISDEELEELGIEMPYRRYRILAGLHKFHKRPFHPKSLHLVPLDEVYSNLDVSIQILSAIKQFIAMEASLKFMMKHCDMSDISKEDLSKMRSSIESVRNRIRSCKNIANGVKKRVKMWDKEIQPVDLITKKSIRYKWPWRKLMFSITIISIVVVIKLK
ncbi:unnamed protein product [Phyllotreta striolata]|uniref:Ankyrin repeat, SAM and basic leucine zipper domain-containing protein 1 n=1 Tax=Phyllotreta striolata TaxID=444603 RepID=A0A9N9TVN5_PHYSR|nr:unnamed protein product [Phyllotreta striolata]